MTDAWNNITAAEAASPPLLDLPAVDLVIGKQANEPRDPIRRPGETSHAPSLG